MVVSGEGEVALAFTTAILQRHGATTVTSPDGPMFTLNSDQ